MKKIGLITLHRVKNYGSILQTFATQEIFKKYGYDTEVIDYYPNRYSFWGMLSDIKHKNPKFEKSLILRTMARILFFPTFLSRFLGMSDFLKKHINLSKDTFHTNTELDNYDAICDAYCVGSDQVWNSGWNNGIDKPFYLDFMSNKYKFSFSSSFGKNEISKDEEEAILPYLKDFKNLSVRENTGTEILKKMGFDSTLVLDPTFMLSKEEWLEVASDKFANKKYILMYNINRTPLLYEYAKKLSKEKNLPIINLSYNLHDIIRPGKLLANPKVEDFLSAFANAEYVVTDSFHGTSFSINLNKKFIVVLPKKYSGRLENILDITGLKSRIVNDVDEIDKADEKINYKKVTEKINVKRKETSNYLDKVFDEIDSFTEIDICSKENCCGCKNCYNICPVHAIRMEKDIEGFEYPVIDKEKCIKCGMCKKVCPILNEIKRTNFLDHPKAFAVRNKNINEIKKSTSGGAFVVFANYILEHNGVVYGSTIDENMVVKHIGIKEKKNINQLMGSKYVYSDLGTLFPIIRKELNEGINVLFSGVPCQIAALKTFLLKDYSNLLTVEVICHGTPNQELFTKYIEYLENKYKGKIVNYEFRSKKRAYWGKFEARANIEYCNGKIKEKYINADFDKYYYSFLKCKNYRDGCYNCKFANPKRNADITLGDFWGIEKLSPKFIDKNGVSIVVLNSSKGMKIFEDVKSNIEYIEEDYNECIKYNGQLLRPSVKPIERVIWYEGFGKKNFITKIKINKKIKFYLKCLIPSSLKMRIKSIIKK